VLDRLVERFGWLRTPVAVHRRVGDVGGGPLASSIALAGFLSLFPLLLVGVAVLGFVSAGDTDFAANAVDELGVTGRAADQVLDVLHNAEDSRRAASALGLAGLLWAGLAVVGTLEQALDATWQVKGRPGWKAKLIDLGWLVGAGLLFLGSLSLGPLATALPGPAVVPTVALGLVLDTVLFLWMFRALTAVAVPWSDHLPGAVAGALGLEVLKVLGGIYVPRAVASSSALYGSLGSVFAVLAWLALSARLVVYASALNVVRHEQRHGTTTVEIRVPNIEGEEPVRVNRGGAVTDVEPSVTPTAASPEPDPDEPTARAPEREPAAPAPEPDPDETTARTPEPDPDEPTARTPEPDPDEPTARAPEPGPAEATPADPGAGTGRT
jgi:YihY family inner membrane protein